MYINFLYKSLLFFAAKLVWALESVTFFHLLSVDLFCTSCEKLLMQDALSGKWKQTNFVRCNGVTVCVVSQKKRFNSYV